MTLPSFMSSLLSHHWQEVLELLLSCDTSSSSAEAIEEAWDRWLEGVEDLGRAVGLTGPYDPLAHPAVAAAMAEAEQAVLAPAADNGERLASSRRGGELGWKGRGKMEVGDLSKSTHPPLGLQP
jgi:hypothetical protein